MENRIYDTPGWTVIVIFVMAVISFALAVWPTWALAQSEVIGAWMVTAICVVMSVLFLYRWAFGTKVRLVPC